MTGVKYPDLYEDFVSVLDLSNLNIGFILSFACVLRTNYYIDLLFATLGPMVVLAVLAGTYTLAIKRNRASQEAIRTVKRRHLSMAIFVVFLIYSSVSHTIFQAFGCEQLDDDIWYLRADYSLECGTSEYDTFMAYAIVMVLVYPIGIPAVFSWWLFQNRSMLRHPSSQSVDAHKVELLRDIWEPYNRSVFYFEIVEYARRVVLTGFSVFIYPGSAAQVAIVLLLSTFFWLIFEVLSPYRTLVDTWLYRTGNCIVFLGMYLALLLKVDVSSEDRHSQDVFSGILIAAHVGLMIAVVLQSTLWLMKPEITEDELPRSVFSLKRHALSGEEA